MKKTLWIVPIIMAACATEPDSETSYAGVNVLSPEALKVAMVKPEFGAHVKPILEAKCAMCHNQNGLPGRLSFANQEAAVKTGTLGVFIVPGHPERSRFITHLTSAHSSLKAMPPVGETLTSEETALLSRWISQGAVWPTGEAGKLITER